MRLGRGRTETREADLDLDEERQTLLLAILSGEIRGEGKMTNRRYNGEKYNFMRNDVERMIAREGTIRAAAKAFGCSYGTLIHACDVLGIERPNRGRTRRSFAKKELSKYQKGHSWAEIAEALGCSVGLVRREFKRLGLSKKDERSKNAEHLCDL